jgi:hypothetical protein
MAVVTANCFFQIFLSAPFAVLGKKQKLPSPETCRLKLFKCQISRSLCCQAAVLDGGQLACENLPEIACLHRLSGRGLFQG